MLICKSNHITLLLRTQQVLPFSLKVKVKVLTVVHQALHHLFSTPSISVTILPSNFPLIHSSYSEVAVPATLPDTVLPQSLCMGSPLYLALFSPSATWVASCFPSDLYSNSTFSGRPSMTTLLTTGTSPSPASTTLYPSSQVFSVTPNTISGGPQSLGYSVINNPKTQWPTITINFSLMQIPLQD